VNTYQGLQHAKVERQSAKLQKRQGYKLRYTVELQESSKVEKVVAHLDLDVAREYVERQPCAYLLPTGTMTPRLLKLAEVARERLFLQVCDRFKV
jgi:hypothetical protein